MAKKSKPRHAYKELSLQQLRSFREVCRARSYAAAARNLHLSSPAVWEQIKALEQHYDLRLLVRHGNGVRPTTVGKRLLNLVGPHLDGLDTTREALRQEQGTWPKEISLVSNLRVLAAEISQGIRQFQQHYNEIRLRLVFIRDEELRALVLDGQADVAFTLEPEPTVPLPSALSYQWSGELDYLLLTRPRHALARKKTLKLRDVLQYPLVLGDMQTYSRRRVQEVFRRHRLVESMSVAVETSSDEYTTSCVRAGVGVGISIGNSQSQLYRGLKVRTLRRWFGTVRTGFARKSGTDPPPVQRELMSEIVRAMTQTLK